MVFVIVEDVALAWALSSAGPVSLVRLFNIRR